MRHAFVKAQAKQQCLRLLSQEPAEVRIYMIGVRWGNKTTEKQLQVMKLIDDTYNGINSLDVRPLADFLLPEDECEEWVRRKASTKARLGR